MKIPEHMPKHLTELAQKGWQHFITTHTEYSQREVSADRLREDETVFMSAFVFGYMARINELHE